MKLKLEDFKIDSIQHTDQILGGKESDCITKSDGCTDGDAGCCDNDLPDDNRCVIA